MWLGALVVVVVVAIVAVRVYVNRQWYVSIQDGKVAVFQGIPSNPLGLTLSHPMDVTDIPASGRRPPAAVARARGRHHAPIRATTPRRWWSRFAATSMRLQSVSGAAT